MAQNLVGLAFMGNASRPSVNVCARNNSITDSGFSGIAAPSGVSWATREDCEYTDHDAGGSSATATIPITMIIPAAITVVTTVPAYPMISSNIRMIPNIVLPKSMNQGSIV